MPGLDSLKAHVGAAFARAFNEILTTNHLVFMNPRKLLTATLEQLMNHGSIKQAKAICYPQ